MQLSNAQDEVTCEPLPTDKLTADNHLVDTQHEPEVQDLRETKFRYLVLVFVCFISFGCYFCYDTPGALQEQFIHDLDITTAEFSMFYSLYSWPNIVMCFFSGYLLDQVFGLRLGTNIFMLITLSGQLIFASGSFVKKYWLMQVGRFIFGVGGESLTVCQSSYAAKWFKGKELNMMFGLELSCARLGATVNFLSMVPVYNALKSPLVEGNITLGYTLLIATISCAVSQSCATVLWFLQGKGEKTFKKVQSTEKKSHGFKLLDIKNFPGSYWLTVFTCVTYYIAVFPFIGISTVLFQKKYDFSATEASRVIGLIYFISMLGTPVMGIVVGHLNCNVLVILVGLSCQLATHLILAYTFWSPWIAMAFMGIGFSLIACGLWPLVATQVSDQLVGTAYGIMISLMNSGLAIFSYLSGQIIDNYGYFILEVVLQVSVCVSIFFCVVLGIVRNNERTCKRIEVVNGTYTHPENLKDRTTTI